MAAEDVHAVGAMKRLIGAWIALVLAGWFLSVYFPPKQLWLDPMKVLDPALDRFVTIKGPSVGDAQRWAYAGISGVRLKTHLEAQGFICTPAPLPPDGPAPRIRTLSCERTVNWPRRIQSLEAQLDYSTAWGRLVKLEARSHLQGGTGGWRSRHIAPLMRRWGRLEPVYQRISGPLLPDIDQFSAYVADAFDERGWYASCSETQWIEMDPEKCRRLAESRRDQGVPAMEPQPLGLPWIGRAQRMLEAIGLKVRVYNPKPTEILALRRDTNGRLWLEMEGTDLAGQTREVDLEVAKGSGQITHMRVRLGRQEKIFATRSGGPDHPSTTSLEYLAPLQAPPEGAPQGYVLNEWLSLPSDPRPEYYAKLLTRLTATDAADAPALMHALLDALQLNQEPEVQLHLYPRLREIEYMATALRGMRVSEWLRPAIARRFMDLTEANAPDRRVAWALALCERENQINQPCWATLMAGDTAAPALLAQALDELDGTYADLDEQNHVRLHLKALRGALED